MEHAFSRVVVSTLIVSSYIHIFVFIFLANLHHYIEFGINLYIRNNRPKFKSSHAVEKPTADSLWLMVTYWCPTCMKLQRDTFISQIKI